MDFNLNFTRPKLEWIGDKCYRRMDLPNADDDSVDVPSFDLTYNDQIESSAAAQGNNGLPQLTQSQIEELDDLGEFSDITLVNGRFQKTCQIPKSFYGVILGAKGATKKKTEAETKTRIDVPFHDDDGNIIIKGSTKTDVESAVKRLYVIVDTARLKYNPSHFISIPMNVDEMKKRFNELKQQVLSHSEISKSRGICDEIFQNENKLHLTIVMLYLGDKQEIHLAKTTVENCQELIKERLNGKELVVTVEGIDIMNDDPSEVSVVYAKIKEDDDLRMIVDEIFTKFVDCKLANRNIEQANSLDKKVKLHLTLMNTTFKEEKNEDNDARNKDKKPWERKQRKDKETFDATAILKHFGSFQFGQFKISQIHLSIRGQYDANGYYQNALVINF